MSNKIIIVQGLQYGSEAKGAISDVICRREGVNIAVRTGGTNAGHTVYYNGKPVKFQQLPVAALIPGIKIVLGAGSLIDPNILVDEVAMVEQLTGENIGLTQRLVVDHRAGIHYPEHAKRSTESGRHHAIGATGKGCSEALIDRIRGRGKDYVNWGQSDYKDDYKTADTAKLLNTAYDDGAKILLEGTQGTLLDLYLGPYPYTTHKQTGPAQWMMEAGLSPALPTDIVGVVRTFPIRVAGNSGPMPRETSWPQLARVINRKRLNLDLAPIVPEYAIKEFEIAAGQAAVSYGLPSWMGNSQHTWTEAEREKHSAAISEINKKALGALEGSVIDQLKQLFEFTTVTKKLRRVAYLDEGKLREASMLTRPHRLAVTFMNYEHPQWWYEQPKESDHAIAVVNYLNYVSAIVGARIDYAGWGPEEHHVQAVEYRCYLDHPRHLGVITNIGE